MNANKTNDALAAYKDHLREIFTLLLNAMGRIDELTESAGTDDINSGHVASMAHTRELAVEMAWTLGVITTEQAKAKHGVIL